MFLNNKPTRVNVTPKSIQKDYEILKKNLPIPIGIDHLDEDILQKNKILQKMNLLNVGTINDAKIENNQIKITDAQITNPTIKELYEQGELTDFSPVSTMYVRNCPTGKSDKVEEYSVIQRVDFVPKGACKTCKVDYTGNASLSDSVERYEAKAIIGDENMVEDPKKGNAANAPDDGSTGNDPDDTAQDATLNDILNAVTDLATSLKTSITAIEGNLGIKETPAAPDATPAAAGSSEEVIVNPELEQLKNDMKEYKAKAAKAEATAIVNPFIKEGKILPADVEKHIGMAMKAPEDYKVIMENAKPIIDMDKHSENGQGQAGTSDLTDSEGNEIDLKETRKQVKGIIGKGV